MTATAVSSTELKQNEGIRTDYKEVLKSISEDIIFDNVVDQIDRSLDMSSLLNKRSLFEYFEIKLESIIKEYPVETDEYPDVCRSIDTLLDGISESIENVFDFELIYSDVIDVELKLEYTKALYEFFTIGLYPRVYKLTLNYIKENMTDLIKEIEMFGIKERENLSYKYLQKDIDNEYTPVIYHTADIVNTISFPDDTFAEDVIETMIEGDEGEAINSVIKRIFIDNEFVDVNYNTNLINILVQAIHGNDMLIKDIKIELINHYRNS